MAKAQRESAEEDLAMHIAGCGPCQEPGQLCPGGYKWLQYVQLMRRQEQTLADPDDDWIQERLF